MLKQKTEENVPFLLRCMDPSHELLGRLRTVPFVKDQVSAINHKSTVDDKNDALLVLLLEAPEDIQESVINGFISALRCSGQEHVANIFRKESDKVPMSDEHHRSLNIKKSRLCQFIDTENKLLGVLVSKEIISPTDENDIRSMPTYDEKARKLIEVLMRKSDDAFDGFIDALNQTGQPHVTYLLTGDKTNQSLNYKVPMSDEHCHTLTTKIDKLCQFVDPENGLLDKLISTEIISIVDAQCIRSIPGYDGKARRLIEMLMRKSDDAFDVFIKALHKTGQSHVTYLLTGDENNQGANDKVPMSDEHCHTLTAKIDHLCQFLDPENGLLDKLISTEVISLIDAQYIRSTSGYNEKARKLIELLTRKSDDAFDGFINALNQTGQAHVAYILTGEGDSLPLSKECRDQLIERRLVVSESITVECLLSYLVSNKVFSSYDQQRVEAQQLSNDKGEMIIDLIVRKSHAAYESFIKTLQESCHEHVVIELIGCEITGKVETKISAQEAEIDEIAKDMQRKFENDDTEVKELNGVLHSKEISVSEISRNCITVKFRCKNHAAVVALQELYRSKELDQLFNKSFGPKFADKGLESLSLSITDEEFQRHIQLKLMTDEHRKALLLSEKVLVKKMKVNDDLLDRLSLCKPRRQAIEQTSTHEQQVKSLLDIVSRQPDSAYKQLLGVLEDVNQHEAASAINQQYSIVTAGISMNEEIKRLLHTPQQFFGLLKYSRHHSGE